MEELQARHREELRDLQFKIIQKRKSATKKTRKGVNDECSTLERELNERYVTELAQLSGESRAERAFEADQSPDAALANIDTTRDKGVSSDSLKRLQISTDGSGRNSDQGAPPLQANDPSMGKKPNRQKARLARRAAKQEAEAAQAAEEASDLPNLREQEKQAMETQFKKLNLLEQEIRPDGHCLYSAVASQLKDIGVGLSSAINPAEGNNEGYKFVRETAAHFMEVHADDFTPFLEEPLDSYIAKVKNTAEWGGQLELQAIARAYGVDINVLQASGRTEKVESALGMGEKQIWLAYYRHYFGLGEHYNALRSKITPFK